MFYDISLPLSANLAPWPGDQAFSRISNARLRGGDAVNLSSVTMSLHFGTHADAPYHYLDEGTAIDELDLDVFVGPARVIDVRGLDPIPVERLLVDVPRILLKTGGNPDPTRFPADFPVLASEAPDHLGRGGVRLVGVDVPSVDKPDSKQLSIHHGLGRNGIHILENLVLDSVPEGLYELIAIPLRIVGADGSPVRAVLRELQ